VSPHLLLWNDSGSDADTRWSSGPRPLIRIASLKNFPTDFFQLEGGARRGRQSLARRDPGSQGMARPAPVSRERLRVRSQQSPETLGAKFSFKKGK
jgi:hypothetical protein